MMGEGDAGQVRRSSAVPLTIARKRKNRDVHHPCRVRLTPHALGKEMSNYRDCSSDEKEPDARFALLVINGRTE
jgi:hypothetical protein